MRLRGLVFERFASFERAEVNFCDEAGAPLDALVFVGESGAGKTALLRGIVGILTEAAGGKSELGPDDVRRGAEDARCRLVLDDLIGPARAIVTIEKEVAREGWSALKGNTAFERWRAELAASEQPRVSVLTEIDGSTFSVIEVPALSRNRGALDWPGREEGSTAGGVVCARRAAATASASRRERPCGATHPRRMRREDRRFPVVVSLTL